MKVLLLGFNYAYFKERDDLTKVLKEAGHEVLFPNFLSLGPPARKERKLIPEHDVVLVPHHREDLFPKDKPWIAIWVIDGWARLTILMTLKNKPLEVIWREQILDSPHILLNALKKVK